MSTTPFEVKAPGYVARVHDSCALQGAMQTLGARLGLVAPGAVNIELDWAAGLTQQHGFLHAGMVATALDSACGYAGLTLMPEEAAVLTIEFKINLLAPARGGRFRLEGSSRAARSLSARSAPTRSTAPRKSWWPPWAAR